MNLSTGKRYGIDAMKEKSTDEIIIGGQLIDASSWLAAWCADKGWVTVDKDQLPSRRYLDSLGLRSVDKIVKGSDIEADV